MKITDLSISLHRWEVPPTTYRDAFGGGSTDVGVVTIHTDEDVVGHSFLGLASAGADQFANQVLKRLKPLIVGRNPLDIGAIWADLWRTNWNVDTRSICVLDVPIGAPQICPDRTDVEWIAAHDQRLEALQYL